MAAVKQLPTSFVRISSFPVSSLALRIEASFVLLYRCTVRGERRVPHKRTWHSQHCPLSGIQYLVTLEAGPGRSSISVYIVQ